MRITDHRLEQIMTVVREMCAERRWSGAEDLLLALQELQELRIERRRQFEAALQRHER
jgi:hypothetical protein